MEEIRYVQPGSPILASQHNALVDAVGGQLNSSPDLQFTRTGGGTIYSANNNFNDLPQSKMDALFEISYAAGELDDRYSAWDEANDDNGFRGIWLKVVNYVKNRQFFYHTQFFPQLNWLINIDPTDKDGKLIWQMPGTVEDDSFQLPLCTADKAASMLVLLVDQLNDNASSSSKAWLGCTVCIVGDWSPWLDEEEANPGEAWAAWMSHELDLTIKLKAVCPALYDVASFRIVGQYQLYDNFKTEMTQDWHFDPVTLNIGQQHIESMPDSTIATAAILSSAQLSSIEFTTAKQFGYLDGAPTFSYSLFNFEKLNSDIANLSSIKGQLSSYDVLVKHKTLNEKVAGNCKADLQYLALSTLLGTVDSQISSLHLSSVQTETWTDPDTREDIKYHQFFGFTDQTMRNIALSDGIDVVVRDYKTTGGNGARTNYVALSDLADVIGGGNVSIDSQNTALSSIGKDSSNNLELYRFSILGDYTTLTAAQYDDIVIRHRRSDTGGAEVSYVQLSNFLIPPTDTEWYGDQRSIEKPNNEYYQLYNFRRDASIEDRSLRVTLRYDGSTRYFRGDGGSSDTKDPNNKVIVKHYDGNGNIVEYDGLEIVAPKVSAADVDGLGEEIGTIIGGDSNISTILSGQLSNVYWVQGDHGGGTCYGQSIGDGNKNVVVDLNGKTLNDSNGVIVDWGIYGLYDAQNLKVDWGNAGLYKNSTHQTLNWANGILYDPNNGNVALNWDVGYAKDPAGSGCTINWNTGHLWSDDNTRVMNWKLKQLIGGWTANGNFRVTNGSLTIGNTTITEAQLQQLLALLNTP